MAAHGLLPGNEGVFYRPQDWLKLREFGTVIVGGNVSTGVSNRSASDQLLAQLAGQGDSDAFALLYDRHSKRVYNYCLRVTTSPDDAADATQQAFLKMLERLPKKAEDIKNFEAYLLTIARNACYRRIEQGKRSSPVDDITLFSGGANFGGEDPDGRIDEHPERQAMLDDQQERVRIANSHLPQRQREVLALRELEELSYGQIGEIIGINENSVAQLISRARINLRKELQTGALVSIAKAEAECGLVLPLITKQQDDQRLSEQETSLLAQHLQTCGHCSASAQAMQEAGMSYRAWLPVGPLLSLRETTIAQAAPVLGKAGRAEKGAGFGTRAHKFVLLSGTLALSVFVAVVVSSNLNDGTGNYPTSNENLEVANKSHLRPAPKTNASGQAVTNIGGGTTVTTDDAPTASTTRKDQVGSDSSSPSKNSVSKDSAKSRHKSTSGASPTTAPTPTQTSAQAETPTPTQTSQTEAATPTPTQTSATTSPTYSYSYTFKTPTFKTPTYSIPSGKTCTTSASGYYYCY